MVDTLVLGVTTHLKILFCILASVGCRAKDQSLEHPADVAVATCMAFPDLGVSRCALGSTKQHGDGRREYRLPRRQALQLGEGSGIGLPAQ